MARLVTSGGEIQDHPTTDVGSPDGYTPGTVATTSDTTNMRGGRACWACAGTTTSTSFRAFPYTAPASGATVYARAYLRTDTLPASGSKKVAALLTSADGALISARLSSTGKLQLWNDAGSAQIGSDSTLTIATGTWYRVQLRLKIAAGAADEAELRVQLDDPQAVEETVASGTSLTISDTHTARFRAGWIDAPGATATMLVDGIGVNDSTGTSSQTSWPGGGKVLLSRTIRSSWSGGTNTDCSGTAPDTTGSNMAEAVNNTPPRGQADHTTAGHSADPDQVRTSGTLTQAKFWGESYASLGVPGDALWQFSLGGTNSIIGDGVNSGPRDGDMLAQQFLVNGTIESIDVSYGTGSAGQQAVDNLIVDLVEDNAGQPTGELLNRWTLAGSASVNVGFRTLTLPTPIAAGRPLWLVFGRDGAFDSVAFWSVKTNPAEFFISTVYMMKRSGSWTSMPTTVNMMIRTTQGVVLPKVAHGWMCHGEAIATGTKTFSSLGVTTGTTATPPSSSGNIGNDAGAAGTYPSLWAWSAAPVIYPALPSSSGYVHGGTRLAVAVTSSTRVSLICFAGVYLEFAETGTGWGRYQKTADSTIWWAKQPSAATTAEITGGVVTTNPGAWIAYPDPQVTAGNDLPSTTVTIEDETFSAGYTPA